MLSPLHFFCSSFQGQKKIFYPVSCPESLLPERPEEVSKLDLYFPMTSYSPFMQGTRIAWDYATLFGDSYETVASYNEPSQFFEFTRYLCQEAAYDEQQLPSNGYENWLSNYGSGFGDCWGDNLFSSGYSNNGNEYGGTLLRSKDSHQAEEQYDTDFSYEDAEIEPAAFEYSPCYDTCSRYIEQLFYQYDKQEARLTCSFSQDEMGFCEGILGYWPCLYHEVQRQAAFVEQ